MGDLPFLERLTQKYKNQAAATGHWVDYIKAHGLANACVTRDPTESRLREIYEIERSWYNGNHPLGTYSGHQEVTKLHNSFLADYRQNTNELLNKLSQEQCNLETDEIFSNVNFNNVQTFSDHIFSLCESCTDDFVYVTRCIIKSSIDTLKNIKLQAPCPFAVIGLGSVARGEVTPYSDLEYAFIVESDLDLNYFTKLAIETYFRIGNLGETPLKCFGIEELKGQGRGEITTVTKVGYRFDGISKNAGNIPTGNGEGRSLILTVDGLVELYEECLKSTSKTKLIGDLSDLLSTYTLIYASDGGEELYQKSREEMLKSINQHQCDPTVINKKLDTLKRDVKEYDFLPKIYSFGPTPDNTNIKVKAHIFRYITLIINHLKILLGLKTDYPWHTLKHLHHSNLLSLENYNNMRIVLALSIYIRTSAYMSLGTQSEQLSLHTSSKGASKSLYHVPRNIFVTLGCLLIPLKLSVISNLENLLKLRGNMRFNLAKAVETFGVGSMTSRSNYLVKLEVLFFAGDFDGALKLLYSKVGEHIVNTSPERFAEKIQKDTQAFKKYHVELCCHLLASAKKETFAMNHLEWLMNNETVGLDMVRWKIAGAEYYGKMHHHIAASNLLKEAMEGLREILELKEQSQSRVGSMLDEKTRGKESLLVFEIAVKAYSLVGENHSSLNRLQQAKESSQVAHNICLSMLISKGIAIPPIAISLASMGNLYLAKGEYAKALYHYNAYLKQLLALYGEETNHSAIAEGYRVVGLLHKWMGNYSTALDFYQKSVNMLESIFGVDIPHSEIATGYHFIGELYSEMAMFEKSLDYLTMALDMFKAVYGDDSSHSEYAAWTLNVIGKVHAKMGQFKLSIEYQKKALALMVSQSVTDANDSNVARMYSDIAHVYSLMGEKTEAIYYCDRSLATIYVKGESEVMASTKPNTLNLNKIGFVYFDMGDHANALKYHTKCLNLMKDLYGKENPEIATAYNNIGLMYLNMKVYKKATENLNKSLKINENLFGKCANHPSIACAYTNLGQLHFDMGQYSKSLECHETALKIRKAAYHKDSSHPDIALTLSNIGSVYAGFGKYSQSLNYRIQSLNMRKSVYRNDHPEVAISCQEIATLYQMMGDHKNSLHYQKEVLEIRLKVYGKDANIPTIATSYSRLATASLKAGELSNAVEYFTKALEIWTVCHGDSLSPQIASCYRDIGRAYMDVKEFDKSLEYHNKSLKLAMELEGDKSNSEDIFQSYTSIASVYSMMREYQKALEYNLTSLNSRKALHGEDSNHPDISLGHRFVGSSYFDLGQYSDSLDHHTKCLVMNQAIYGDDCDHPHVADTYNSLGEIHVALGDFDKAIKCHLKSLDIRKAVYGEASNHIELDYSFFNLGDAYSAMGDYANSLIFYTKSLEVRKIVYNEVHADIANGYFMVGVTLYHLNEHHSSLENLNKFVQITLSLYGENSNRPDVAGCYTLIGNLHSELNNLQASLEYHIKSLDMKKATEADDSLDIVNRYSDIGVALYKMSRYAESVEYLKKSLEISQTRFANGDTSIQLWISRYLHNIGMVYFLMGNYGSSLKYYTECLKVSKSFYTQADNGLLALRYDNLGNLYTTIGEPLKAIDYFTESYNIRTSMYKTDPNHADLAWSYNNLAMTHLDAGETSKSLEYLEKAINTLELWRHQCDSQDLLATVYNNIGVLQRERGHYLESYDYLCKSLDVKKSIYGDEPNLDMFLSYTSFARLYQAIGQYSLSSNFYNQALIHATQITIAPIRISKMYVSISEMLMQSSQYKKALPFLERALKKSLTWAEEFNHNIQHQAHIRLLLGICTLHLKLWKTSWNFVYSALCIIQSLPQPLSRRSNFLLARLHFSVALLCLFLNHIPQAVEHSVLALDLTTDLLDDRANVILECELFHREAKLLVDCLFWLVSLNAG